MKSRENQNQAEAVFRVYAELNDHLPAGRRQRQFVYRFNGRPAVKDAIEALGIPHPEIDLIIVNGRSVDFSYKLDDSDIVAVYPVFEGLDIQPLVKLRPKPLRKSCFIADLNLGGLIRSLRMLGLDCEAKDGTRRDEFISQALEQNRIILTRDKSLLRHSQVTHGYWVRAIRPMQQTVEVVYRFDLESQFRTFSRCMICNSVLAAVTLQEAGDKIPDGCKGKFQKFLECAGCGRVYWKGTHYKKMQQKIDKIVEQVKILREES